MHTTMDVKVIGEQYLEVLESSMVIVWTDVTASLCQHLTLKTHNKGGYGETSLHRYQNDEDKV